jgi:uncharacterized protein
MESSNVPAFDSTQPPRFGRTLDVALFVTSAAWIVCAQAVAAKAARGLAMRFDLPAGEFLLASVFLLFLLAVGFSILQMIARRNTGLREVLGLPKRPTAGREWALGLAIGWGIVVLAVLPMALARTLDTKLWTQPRAFWLVLVNLTTIAVAALAEEVAFRGYAYRRLIEAMGPARATLVLSVLFGLLHTFNPEATWISVVITMLAGLLLALGWLRTHGLWLPWGLHFGWNASMGILFGLPVSGLTNFSSVVETRAIGRAWLTGGNYGPEAAIFTALVLLVAIGVLVRTTRDYAWHYTYEAIVPGGYPMDVAPPPAHAAMEQQEKAGQLVQILPTTPQSRSAGDEPKL